MAKKINYASLYTLRSDGRYQTSYTDETGRHYVSAYDAEELYFKVQKLRAPKETKPILFEEILDLWEYEEYEHMPEGTRASYSAHIKRARERFGKMEAKSITPNDINTMLLIMKNQGKAASTINKMLIVLRGTFQTAIVHPQYGKVIRENPAQYVKIPRGTPKPQKREAPEDDIVKKIQENATTAYFGLFAMFLICTGMRRGEALAVQWGDIDFKNDEIHCTKSLSLRGSGAITPPKTASGIRTIPLLAPLKKVLKRPEGSRRTDYVFSSVNDPSKPMCSKNYARNWHHYCRDMGFLAQEKAIKRNAKGEEQEYIKEKNLLTAHTMRHGFATIIYEAGLDVYEAQRLLGHADLETTQSIYTHLRNRKQQSATEKLKSATKTQLYNIVPVAKDKKKNAK